MQFMIRLAQSRQQPNAKETGRACLHRDDAVIPLRREIARGRRPPTRPKTLLAGKRKRKHRSALHLFRSRGSGHKAGGTTHDARIIRPSAR